MQYVGQTGRALKKRFGDHYRRMNKSRKENPQKLTQLSSRSHPRHLVGKRIVVRQEVSNFDSSVVVHELELKIKPKKNDYFLYRHFKRKGHTSANILVQPMEKIAYDKNSTSCLTTIKNHAIKYCTKVYERSGKNLFWSIKNSCEVLNKLKSRGFRASSLSTYDFSTLYTTLPHNLIKDKLVDLIERTFQREGSLYIACNDKNAFFTSDAVRNYNLWSCQKVCEALTFLLDNIYIRFGS